MSMNDYDILVAPIVTEKATIMSDDGKIVFKVPLKANKKEIKNAVERLFKVSVTSVNTLRVKGKKKVFKGKPYMRSDFKKAIVTLKEGQTIDIAAGL